LALLVLWRQGVDLLAPSQELADIAIEGEIEMRNGELRLDQAARNHSAHVVMRHDLVAAGLEQRANPLVGRGRNGRHWRRGWDGRRRCDQPLAGFCGFDVARNDSPVRTGTLNAAKLEGRFLCEAAGKWRGKDAVGAALSACESLGPAIGARALRDLR